MLPIIQERRTEEEIENIAACEMAVHHDDVNTIAEMAATRLNGLEPWTQHFLSLAVDYQAINVLKKLLELYPDANNIDSLSKLLCIAAATGNVEIGKFLIDAGADVDYKDENGCAPIHMAANAEFCRLLKYRGADLDAQIGREYQSEKATPLYTALINGDLAKFMSLEEQGENLRETRVNGDTLAHVATQKNKIEILKYIAQKAPDLINELNNENISPLCMAITERKLDFVRSLIPVANMNQTIFLGNTILHIAIRFEMPLEIIQEMLTYGADPTMVDWEGMTPSAIATEKGFDDLARMLLTIDIDSINGLKDLTVETNPSKRKRTAEAEEKSTRCFVEHVSMFETASKTSSNEKTSLDTPNNSI